MKLCNANVSKQPKLQGKLKQEIIYGENLVPLDKDKCVRYCLIQILSKCERIVRF